MVMVLFCLFLVSLAYRHRIVFEKRRKIHVEFSNIVFLVMKYHGMIKVLTLSVKFLSHPITSSVSHTNELELFKKYTIFTFFVFHGGAVPKTNRIERASALTT